MTSPDHSAIEAELMRIEESADYSSQSQFTATKFWRGISLALGTAATGLAGVAGVGGLADAVGATTAGILAIAAAGIGGIVTALNPARRSEEAHVAANGYLSLRDDSRVLRTIDLPELDSQQARAAFGELTARRTELNSGSPVPASFAYRLGKRNIEQGRTKHVIDKG
jgi:cbb3-type cytochrome oxidase subunit 3